jgi:hypothetical protein
VAPGVLHRPARGEGRRWQRYVIAAAIVVVLTGLPLGGVLMLRQDAARVPETVPGAQVLKGLVYTQSGTKEPAFRLILPRGAWEGNDALKRGLKAVVGLDRKEAENSKTAAWLAVAVQDYGTQQPRDGELLKRALERLEGYFGENLELGERPEPCELAGRPALALRFRGSVNNVEWTGECYMLARHGFGYWFFIAGAPGLAIAQQALAELQADKGEGLVLADERKGWSERPLKMQSFVAAKLPFTLTGRDGVWQAFENLKDVDARAEMYLLGKNTDDRKDNLKSATVLALGLPPAADDKEAMKAARAYLEAAKKEESKDYTLEVIQEKKGEPQPPDGFVLKLGERLCRVTELRLARGAESLKYVLLAVVTTPRGVLACQCEAHWQHHQAWRGDFLELLGTLHWHGPAGR